MESITIVKLKRLLFGYLVNRLLDRGEALPPCLQTPNALRPSLALEGHLLIEKGRRFEMQILRRGRNGEIGLLILHLLQKSNGY